MDDPQRLKALLGQTAKLNFHLVDQNVGAFEVVKRAAHAARVATGLYRYRTNCALSHQTPRHGQR